MRYLLLILLYVFISPSFLYAKSDIELIKEGGSAITPSFNYSYSIRNDEYYTTIGCSFLYSGIKMYTWYNLERENNGLYTWYTKVFGNAYLHLGFDYYYNDYYGKYIDALWWGGGLFIPLDESFDFNIETFRATISEDGYKFWENNIGLSYNFSDNFILSLRNRIIIDEYDIYPGFSLRVAYRVIAIHND